MLARGGGSVEDLLPFSDEALCRAVSACRTPVVSAIGHEPDHPIVDDVADVRCSTPTDAGKRVVPDAAAEARHIDMLRHRARRALSSWVTAETARVARWTNAAVLADPIGPLERRNTEVVRLAGRVRDAMLSGISEGDRFWSTDGRNSPSWGRRPPWSAGTRWSRWADSAVGARIPQDAPSGTALRIRLAGGAVLATSDGPDRDHASGQPEQRTEDPA